MWGFANLVLSECKLKIWILFLLGFRNKKVIWKLILGLDLCFSLHCSGAEARFDHSKSGAVTTWSVVDCCLSSVSHFTM